ncbi:hypothetical protein RintRC_2997 [Richelia intracellularis]|nr:hypothetical protein RintRC_2997 [Richelia intracellularis]
MIVEVIHLRKRGLEWHCLSLFLRAYDQEDSSSNDNIP